MSEEFDLSITRRIDAPVDAVWRAWTGHFAQWWTPAPWTTELIEADYRAGGRIALVMRGPSGEQHRSDDVFLEVVPGRRIVMTNAFSVGWVPQTPFMVRIDAFAEDAGGTRYTATARHWDAAARDRHLAMGFEAGWNASADQLAEVAKRLVE